MNKIIFSNCALAVCGVLLGGCNSAFAQHAPLSGNTKAPIDEPPIVVRERTEFVNLTVTVTDRSGRAISGLAAQDIEVYEDKVKQKIEHYGAEDAPISVGVVFDVSGSMRNKIEQARDAIKAFVETSHADDVFFLVGFNRRSDLLAEFCDGEALQRSLTMVAAQGETALYDAVLLGAEKVRQGQHSKRALLVISDGQDNASQYTVDQLRQRLKESDVQIYCVGIGRPGSSEKAAQRQEMRGQMILDGIARLSGGRAFFVNSASELAEATTLVALELRHQYSLGYMPTNQRRDGKWRKIRVRVNRSARTPELTVRARDGYYAATSP
ncbi:MAG TPA: VWA domain-containing protein [Blastocatellia bacterium]|nr:VWA domain-containing protein [Blastocatellia bacterium]